MSSPSTLRSRSNGKTPDTTSPHSSDASSAHKPSTRFSFLDVIRVLGGLALLSTALSYFITGTYTWSQAQSLWTNPNWVKWKLLGDVHLTPAELAQYDGTDLKKPIYIALNGSIYDVSASPHFYGPGGGYHVFAGVDATRAFVTGCFKEDRTDDMRGAEDIYMPLDLDEAPKESGMSDEEKKEARRDWKNRRARARKIALEKVQTGIEGWKKSFEGSKDKYSGGKTKYFRVGSVKLTDEELKVREQRAKPVLCERAVKMRPKQAAELGIL